MFTVQTAISTVQPKEIIILSAYGRREQNRRRYGRMDGGALGYYYKLLTLVRWALRWHKDRSITTERGSRDSIAALMKTGRVRQGNMETDRERERGGQRLKQIKQKIDLRPNASPATRPVLERRTPHRLQMVGFMSSG